MYAANVRQRIPNRSIVAAKALLLTLLAAIWCFSNTIQAGASPPPPDDVHRMSILGVRSWDEGLLGGAGQVQAQFSPLQGEGHVDPSFARFARSHAVVPTIMFQGEGLFDPTRNNLAKRPFVAHAGHFQGEGLVGPGSDT